MVELPIRSVVPALERQLLIEEGQGQRGSTLLIPLVSASADSRVPTGVAPGTQWPGHRRAPMLPSVNSVGAADLAV